MDPSLPIRVQLHRRRQLRFLLPLPGVRHRRRSTLSGGLASAVPWLRPRLARGGEVIYAKPCILT